MKYMLLNYKNGKGHITLKCNKRVLGPSVNSKERAGSIRLACWAMPQFTGRHNLSSKEVIKTNEILLLAQCVLEKDIKS